MKILIAYEEALKAKSEYASYVTISVCGVNYSTGICGRSKLLHHALHSCLFSPPWSHASPDASSYLISSSFGFLVPSLFHPRLEGFLYRIGGCTNNICDLLFVSLMTTYISPTRFHAFQSWITKLALAYVYIHTYRCVYIYTHTHTHTNANCWQKN